MSMILTLQEQFSETEANAVCETFCNKEILKGLFVSLFSVQWY